MDMKTNIFSSNGPAVLAGYFGDDSRPVSFKEFMEFWDSLTDSEKLYYRTTTLV